jgi:hypothetical protein
MQLIELLPREHIVAPLQATTLRARWSNWSTSWRQRGVR